MPWGEHSQRKKVELSEAAHAILEALSHGTIKNIDVLLNYFENEGVASVLWEELFAFEFSQNPRDFPVCLAIPWIKVLLNKGGHQAMMYCGDPEGRYELSEPFKVAIRSMPVSVIQSIGKARSQMLPQEDWLQFIQLKAAVGCTEDLLVCLNYQHDQQSVGHSQTLLQWSKAALEYAVVHKHFDCARAILAWVAQHQDRVFGSNEQKTEFLRFFCQFGHSGLRGSLRYLEKIIESEEIAFLLSMMQSMELISIGVDSDSILPWKSKPAFWAWACSLDNSEEVLEILIGHVPRGARHLYVRPSRLGHENIPFIQALERKNYTQAQWMLSHSSGEAIQSVGAEKWASLCVDLIEIINAQNASGDTAEPLLLAVFDQLLMTLKSADLLESVLFYGSDAEAETVWSHLVSSASDEFGYLSCVLASVPAEERLAWLQKSVDNTQAGTKRFEMLLEKVAEQTLGLSDPSKEKALWGRFFTVLSDLGISVEALLSAFGGELFFSFIGQECTNVLASHVTTDVFTHWYPNAAAFKAIQTPQQLSEALNLYELELVVREKHNQPYKPLAWLGRMLPWLSRLFGGYSLTEKRAALRRLRGAVQREGLIHVDDFSAMHALSRVDALDSRLLDGGAKSDTDSLPPLEQPTTDNALTCSDLQCKHGLFSRPVHAQGRLGQLAEQVVAVHRAKSAGQSR